MGLLTLLRSTTNIVLLIKQNVSVLCELPHCIKTLSNWLDVVIVVFKPDSAGSVFDEAVVVATLSRISFMHDNCV